MIAWLLIAAGVFVILAALWFSIGIPLMRAENRIDDQHPDAPEIHHDEYAPPAVCESPGCWRWAGHAGECIPWHRNLDPAPQTPAAAEATAPHAPPPPVTTPLEDAAHAMDAVRAMTADDYLATLEAATTYTDQPPFGDWERGDSITMPAIRVDGDCDGELSIPAEVLHEMEAGV